MLGLYPICIILMTLLMAMFARLAMHFPTCLHNADLNSMYAKTNVSPNSEQMFARQGPDQNMSRGRGQTHDFASSTKTREITDGRLCFMCWKVQKYLCVVLNDLLLPRGGVRADPNVYDLICV